MRRSGKYNLNAPSDVNTGREKAFLGDVLVLRAENNFRLVFDLKSYLFNLCPNMVLLNIGKLIK